MTPPSSPGFLDILPWDSELFGFSVARLLPDWAKTIAPESLNACLSALDIRLAYGFAPWKHDISMNAIALAGGLLVDHKVVYRKAVPPRPERPEVVGTYSGGLTDDLMGLALASGAFSRFKLDPKIPPGVFQQMYGTWMRKSLSGELADEVLVSGDAQGLVGMVTVANRQGKAEIGLVAVAERARGCGLGRSLMQAVDQWAHSQGLPFVQVVTQGANEPACRLYAGSGFDRVEEQAVYHLWLD